jgi:recombination protein U
VGADQRSDENRGPTDRRNWKGVWRMVRRNKQYIGNRTRNKERKADPDEALVKDKSQSRRGMSFESQIETTNTHYFHTELAIIQKIPTPTKNIKGRIVYSSKSTVDFIGVALGGAVAFEAKETSKDTNFPLFRRRDGRDVELVPLHQRDFLRKWKDNGGWAFYLISFSALGRCYRVPVHFIDEYYQESYNGGRKSIPIKSFKDEWIVDVEDYLDII